MNNNFEKEERVRDRIREAEITCIDPEKHYEEVSTLSVKKLRKICKEEGTTFENYLEYMKNRKQ